MATSKVTDSRSMKFVDTVESNTNAISNSQVVDTSSTVETFNPKKNISSKSFSRMVKSDPKVVPDRLVVGAAPYAGGTRDQKKKAISPSASATHSSAETAVSSGCPSTLFKDIRSHACQLSKDPSSLSSRRYRACFRMERIIPLHLLRNLRVGTDF